MAIRDFGTSFLANVRARKDAGQAEARKYADKQQNKTIFKTLGLQAAGYLGKEIFASINAGTAQKTEDFLANSELQNNKIKVSQFEKELGVSITERKANRMSLFFSLLAYLRASACPASLRALTFASSDVPKSLIAMFLNSCWSSHKAT